MAGVLGDLKREISWYMLRYLWSLEGIRSYMGSNQFQKWGVLVYI